MKHRSTPTTNYTEELDNISWKEYVGGTKVKQHLGLSSTVLYLLQHRATISSATMPVLKTDSICVSCNYTINEGEKCLQLLLSLTGEDEIKSHICSSCVK